MCLIFIAHRSHDQFPLVVAANRDEFFTRQTTQAHLWPNGVLAGKDELAGGTWLGVNRKNRQLRFAAITNRRGRADAASTRSRGELTTQFLTSSVSAQDYADSLSSHAQDFAGFNLLLSDGNSLLYVTNDETSSGPILLNPGIYGLSNGVLDEPWPKLVRGKQRFTELISNAHDLETDALIRLMDDRSKPADEDLPSRGLPLALERRLSSLFIENEPAENDLRDYGTLCSTALVLDQQGLLRFHERNFDSLGRANRSRFFHMS